MADLIETLRERKAAIAEVDPIVAAEARVSVARDARDTATRAVQAAQATAAAADKALTKALSDLNALRPPLTEIERYRQVVARGQEERRARVERAKLYPAGPGAPSKLDAVLAASGRRGHGNRRPNYGGSK